MFSRDLGESSRQDVTVCRAGRAARVEAARVCPRLRARSRRGSAGPDPALSRAASEALQRGDDAVEGRDVHTGRVPVLGRRVIRPHQLPRVGAERGCGSYRLTLEIDTTARREQASGGLAEGRAQPSVEIPRVLPAERDLALEPLGRAVSPALSVRAAARDPDSNDEGSVACNDRPSARARPVSATATTTTRYTCVINEARPGVSTIAPMRT